MFVIITNDCGDCDYLDDYDCRDCRDDRDTELCEDILFVLFLVFDNSTGCPKKESTIKQTKMAKHGRLVNIPKWSKRVQKGPKWSIRVFWTIRDPFGSL